MGRATHQDCGSVDHRLHRRLFLQGTGCASAASLMSFTGLFSVPALAEEVKRQEKRCILLWLCGAPSQFENVGPQDWTSPRAGHSVRSQPDCPAFDFQI